MGLDGDIGHHTVKGRRQHPTLQFVLGSSEVGLGDGQLVL